ncbi:Uncharacterised protein [Mycobacteroides abscessus subsp. abscessus]|nr:Uncharacterised protein [Mycobacteroides abscessus subsp. abscessus]
MTIVVRPRLSSSISTTPRILIEPRPVVYASWMPWVPTIRPAVGKSGPLIRSMHAARVVSSSASWLSSAQ